MDKSGFIDFMELKLMMEKLGEPQTHLALKEMIKTVDEDNDGEISFREVSRWIILGGACPVGVWLTAVCWCAHGRLFSSLAKFDCVT